MRRVEIVWDDQTKTGGANIDNDGVLIFADCCGCHTETTDREKVRQLRDALTTWLEGARFDQAPDADEALRERVARAMFHVAASASGCVDEDEDDPGDFLDDYRQLADAAIAVIRGDHDA